MTPDKRVEIAQTLIDLEVEIDTHQDGDAFIKTFTFNEAQLEALLTQYHQDLMSEVEEKLIGLHDRLADYNDSEYRANYLSEAQTIIKSLSK